MVLTHRVGLWIGSFLVLLGLGCAASFLLPVDDVRTAPSFPDKKFKRQIAEDVKLSRHGLYGVNLVECGKCSIEKLKRGCLTFGGFNVLVLENLKIVLPPSMNRLDEEREESLKQDIGSARAVLNGLGVDESVWTVQGIGKSFSGLRIKGLEVSRLENGRVVGLFRARQGEAESDGLHLVDCDVLAGECQRVPHAVLKLKPELHLEWTNGKLNLRER